MHGGQAIVSGSQLSPPILGLAGVSRKLSAFVVSTITLEPSHQPSAFMFSLHWCLFHDFLISYLYEVWEALTSLCAEFFLAALLDCASN